MSLEESIKTLNENIQQLTLAITLLNYSNGVRPDLSQVEESLKQTAQPEPKKAKIEAEQPAPTCEPLTVADLKKEVNDPAQLRVELQEICSSKIVKDRTLKPHIVKIISEYNGATHLAKVADVHLEELKERLSAL